MLTTIALSLLLKSPPLPPVPVFSVSHVNVHRSFAGKLGTRQDLQFQIQIGDHLDTVRVGRQHTRFGTPLNLKDGDQVTISDFCDQTDQVITADRIQIVKD